MILATDTLYNNDLAVVAGVCFNKWADSKPEKEFITFVNKIQEYEPGQFYKREMPCIIKLIESLNDLPDLIVIGWICIFRKRA